MDDPLIRCVECRNPPRPMACGTDDGAGRWCCLVACAEASNRRRRDAQADHLLSWAMPVGRSSMWPAVWRADAVSRGDELRLELQDDRRRAIDWWAVLLVGLLALAVLL